jgi:hypothetical protein
MEARPASPLVVPVEVAPILKFPHYYVILSIGPKGNFVIILVCNLLRYCICSPYYSLCM